MRNTKKPAEKKKLKRNYTDRTLKVLFGLSPNHCAYPDCTNPVIAPSTDHSDPIVLSQICHIYALNEDGPRGKAGLTEKELNAPENLILLCPTHHAIVDGQHGTYPASLLLKWKQTHQEEMQKRFSADPKTIQDGVFSHPYFPVSLVDQKIQDEVDTLRKSRFFVEFDTAESSLVLARKLLKGELSGGTGAIRSRALAWCARLLSRAEHLERAEEYLKIAKTLGRGREIDIASAFISSQKGNKTDALGILAHIDAPIARSAALMIVAHHDGSQAALDWMQAAGIDTEDLDPEGKNILLMHMLKLGQWAAARETLDAVNDNDRRDAPVLHHITAIIYLLGTVPVEFRGVVLNQLPFQPADFPLASDARAIDARRLARKHFVKATEAAKQLDCPVAATGDDEYALWLELTDPDEADNGRQRLESRLRDAKPALRLVHLGLQFGVNLDLEAVEREIERQIALRGGMTHDTAMARFALAFTRKTPEQAANYISRHRDQLAKYLDKKSMQCLEIELLSQAGQPERATEWLNALLEQGLSSAEEGRLRRTIAEAEGIDPIEARREQYGQTDSLSDLANLVDELERRREWEQLCEYAEELFQRTQSLQDAERLAIALNNAHKSERVVAFLKDKTDFLIQSRKLHLLYCWSLYHEGELLESRGELSKVNDAPDNRNHGALQVNLYIGLGDWNSLSAYVLSEFRQKENRSAQDLIAAAQLALRLGAPYAKDLLFAAAGKAEDDAAVLATAYFLASSGGWESDPRVHRWLHRAAELSGDDGPIQKMSLQDMLDLKPEWERRESETWRLITRGDTPMFVAAEALNKSLIDLMLFPVLANQSESDPRRRNAVPAYSGKRQPMSPDFGKTVGVDATALLSLSVLNLLDVALDAFTEVYLPHSTLAWLFKEKQKAAFHQPSKIRDAHRIRALLATDALEKFVPDTLPDSDLSAHVGDELAHLISEAEKARESDRPQCIVVRSSPVYRVASLMEEEADLTIHAAVLSSCQAIVDKLRQKGQITTEEERRARSYLHLHEKPWPNQPEIADGAILYLDDLAITYFLHLGMLEKLKAAGFKAIISPRKVDESNQLISYEAISSKVDEAIERIRSSVNSRIESGKIKLRKRSNIEKENTQSISDHPSFGVIALAKDCDFILTDDRFLNQHANIEHDGAQAKIVCTLDLLDALVSSDAISPQDRSEYKTLLRRGGYFLVPVSEDELSAHLEESGVHQGRIVETAELKAIRENILHVRMSTWLQLPKEAHWLDKLLKTFLRALKSQWSGDADISTVLARSDWILDQLDVRGWAHCLGAEGGDNLISVGSVAHFMLLSTLDIVSPEIKTQYWNWIEGRVLAPIEKEDPDLYAQIVEAYRQQIAYFANTDPGEQLTNTPYIRSALAQAALEMAPPLIQRTLIKNADFREEYGFTADAVLSFGDPEVSIKRSDLLSAIRTLLSGRKQFDVADTENRKWRIRKNVAEGDLPRFTMARNKQRLVLPDFCALSSDRETRLRTLDEAAADVNLPENASDRWRSILEERPLEDDELDAYHCDLRDTPVHIARVIKSEIQARKSSISWMVPASRRYFERLVGPYASSTSIRDYASEIAKKHFSQLSAWRPYEGFLFSLLLSSHASLTAEIHVEKLSDVELARAFDFLKKHGDRLSQLGGIEVGLRILPSRPFILESLEQLILHIRNDDVGQPTSGFTLLSSLYILVDGELSRMRILAAEPPFYRRLAALSQAALIYLQLVNTAVDFDKFSEWVLTHRLGRFYFQSLADMRMEPRWNPELVTASLIKAHFFGRIMIAANKNEQNATNTLLAPLIPEKGAGSIYASNDLYHACFPGPLEGADEPQNLMPPEMLETIKTQLASESVGPSSFIALVNSTSIFSIGKEQAELAAEAIKLGSYRLSNVEDRPQLLAVLNGLASVAAVARSHQLADELRIMVRRYMRDPRYSLSIDEALRICVVAGASRADLNDWRDFVGNWLTELAFGDLKGNEGEMLYAWLQNLCHSVPELWMTCGRAEAALMAYNSR